MKPRYVSLALALGLFVLALWVAFRPAAPRSAPDNATASPAASVAVVSPAAPNRQTAQTPVAPAVSQTPAVSTPAVAVLPSARSPGSPAASPAPADTAAAATAAGGTPAPRDARIDVDKVRLMMRDYHTIAGENPVGTNAEIMKAIMGGNSKEATLGPPEGITLNAKGELIDQWSTPYFFHQLSKDLMEIRSAGPDKVMWTADDIVTR